MPCTLRASRIRVDNTIVDFGPEASSQRMPPSGRSDRSIIRAPECGLAAPRQVRSFRPRRRAAAAPSGPADDSAGRNRIRLRRACRNAYRRAGWTHAVAAAGRADARRTRRSSDRSPTVPNHGSPAMCCRTTDSAARRWALRRALHPSRRLSRAPSESRPAEFQDRAARLHAFLLGALLAQVERHFGIVLHLREVDDGVAFLTVITQHQGIASTELTIVSRPSSSNRIRSARPASWRLCVTTTTAVSYSRARRKKISCKRSALA